MLNLDVEQISKQLMIEIPIEKLEDYKFVTEEMAFLSCFAYFSLSSEDITFVIYFSLKPFNCINLFYSNTKGFPFGKESCFHI